ncbi:unnamed protein product, partial [Allacma fusca]
GIYGRSKESLISRSRELKRKIQKTNLKEFAPEAKDCYFKVLQTLGWKVYWEQLSIDQKVDDCSFNYVDSNFSYWKMHEDLKTEPVIAVDLEGNEWSSYSGCICLVQISTRKNNYLIDALAVPQEICDNLKEVLEDKRILKVMHGAANDIKWLQRDFDIYICPLVDTQFVDLKLGPDYPDPQGAPPGFSTLVNKLLHIKISTAEDVLGQLSDYSARPLHQDLQKFACNDTRLLLHCFVALTSSSTNFKLVLEKSALLCKRSVWISEKYPTVHEEMPEPMPHKVEVRFKALHEFRETQSKLQDRKPQDLIPTPVLKTIAFGKRCSPLRQFRMERDLSSVANRRVPKVKFLGVCFRCRKYHGDVAAHCLAEKAPKCAAEKEFYNMNPTELPKLEAEKQRIKLKRSKRRIAAALVRYSKDGERFLLLTSRTGTAQQVNELCYEDDETGHSG